MPYVSHSFFVKNKFRIYFLDFVLPSVLFRYLEEALTLCRLVVQFFHQILWHSLVNIFYLVFKLLFIAHWCFFQPNHSVDWSKGPWKWCCFLSSCKFRKKSVGKACWSGFCSCYHNPTSSRRLDRGIWWHDWYIIARKFVILRYVMHF